MLKRSWWIIALAALCAIGAALLSAYFATPIYVASARFIVSPNPSYLGGESNVIYSLDTLDKRSVITTYAEVLNSPRIYSETVASQNLAYKDLSQYSHGAVVLPDTNIVDFSVQGPDPELVALLANSIGQQAVKYTQSLYQVYDMTLLDPATIPTKPISPRPLQDAAVALVIGSVIGIALALARELIQAPIVNFMQQRKLDVVSLAVNRATFEENLEDAAFASAVDLSLCIIHLNGLTDYINVLPQPTLETILRYVTQTMKNQLRGNDMVGRWSEVEFAVLLSETRGNAALNTMERVRSSLSIPIHVDILGEELQLHPKVGVAEYRVGDTAKSLVANTNWALEIAKKNGGMYLLSATQPV